MCCVPSNQGRQFFSGRDWFFLGCGQDRGCTVHPSTTSSKVLCPPYMHTTPTFRKGQARQDKVLVTFATSELGNGKRFPSQCCLPGNERKVVQHMQAESGLHAMPWMEGWVVMKTCGDGELGMRERMHMHGAMHGAMGGGFVHHANMPCNQSSRSSSNPTAVANQKPHWYRKQASDLVIRQTKDCGRQPAGATSQRPWHTTTANDQSKHAQKTSIHAQMNNQGPYVIV